MTIKYGTLNSENIKAIKVRNISKKDGVYTFRGIHYRLKDGRVTHYCVGGEILENFGYFNTQVGKYETEAQVITLLKGIK